MKWTIEAEEAIKKVPFFVRKKVRARIEEYTKTVGKKLVSLADVKTAQAQFLSKMSGEIKGYQVDTCFGAGGCPNRVGRSENLIEKIEKHLAREDLLSFLKQNVNGELKFHHEFRVTVADCPNACSQPQIKDIGIIGASLPQITSEACTLCNACVAACPDRCVVLNMVDGIPDIDMDRCLACGKCITSCPTGTIAEKKKGTAFSWEENWADTPDWPGSFPVFILKMKCLKSFKSALAFIKSTVPEENVLLKFSTIRSSTA